MLFRSSKYCAPETLRRIDAIDRLWVGLNENGSVGGRGLTGRLTGYIRPDEAIDSLELIFPPTSPSVELAIMLSSSHHCTLLTMVLAGAWLAPTSLAVSCDYDVVDRKQCAQAVSQIVYDQPKNVLDRVSSRFAKLSGNCTISVLNPNKDVVTKQQIEAGFTSIFDKCQPWTGQSPLFNSVYLQVQDHQSGHDTDYFAPEKLTCGLNSNAPLTLDKDCQTAFKSIPVDNKGRMLGDKGQPTSSILKTLNTCTVHIYTTDDSPLIAKKSEIGSVVSKTIKECQGKSGVIGLTKGGGGNNGLTVIKVRSSKRCGSKTDSEGQFCF